MAIALRDKIPCPDCERHDIGSTHWCGEFSKAGPMCWYCWGPVNPIVKRGMLRGWQTFCSDTCKKLGSRPWGKGRPTARVIDLIHQVANRTDREEAA